VKSEEFIQYPLSRDEHAAMARCVAAIRRQLQDVSDLFVARYGRDSSIADTAVKSLISSTLLEHELLALEGDISLPDSKFEDMARAAY
jgi:hypothetical protein